ncbi:MAG TPA: LacI family DNA-binding transcriptional regulator [Dermatophilaceae bacterium]|nr:LacI family DNA-binding transcriptional regulator [Dermatophilaceae bacterium]
MARARGKPVTAADVAARAGVSRTAVSFVLNGRDAGNVSSPTRDRILAAAADLGYTPNLVASSLRRQSTRQVGIITDTIASSPFAGRLLRGAVDRASERGFMVSLFDTAQRPERESSAAHELLRRRADGILYASMGLREVTDLPDVGLPMVLANCYVAGDALPCVIPDETLGGRTAAQYLLGNGHRRVTMLGGSGAVAGPLRAGGFRSAMRSAGLDPAATPVVEAGWTIDAGYAAACRVLNPPPEGESPTAVFAVNDRVALGAMLAAARLGLDVPGDLSIVGFDDQEELAANLVPALTTLALPHHQMGERAMDVLLDLHAEALEPDRPRRQLLDCPLMVRDSVSPPRR